MSVVFPPEVARFLDVCVREYDALAASVTDSRRAVSPETTLNLIELAASFAGMHHPGRFADGGIENLAIEVGRCLPAPKRTTLAPSVLAEASPGLGGGRRVLHVATTIQSIAGHTRTIIHWMRKDPSSSHSLVLTAQGQVPVPPAVLEAVHMAGGRLVSFPEQAPIIDRARWLRRLAADSADIVVMHLAPNDVVPVVAFAVDGPPVALVNLADQCFWLGATVADSVIHLREIGATSSRELRSTRGDVLLPIPLSESQPELDREAARAALGIAAGQVMLLTVGRSLKYAPSSRQSFFRAAAAILDRRPEAHLYLVGIRAEDHRNSIGFVHHERMRFVGPIEDPTVYQRAADIYLEGFPFGSQTALLESVLPGVPCVLAHSTATPLLATQDFALDGIVDMPVDEGDYVERAVNLIANAARRTSLGAELRRQVRHYHVDSTWNDHLGASYAAVVSQPHRSVEIPAAAGASRTVDLAIAEYHATRLRGGDPAAEIKRVIHDALKGGAFWLRHRGEFAGALRFLRFAEAVPVSERNTVVETSKLYAHWALSRILNVSPRR